MNSWKNKLKDSLKSGLNKAVDHGLVSTVNAVGSFNDRHPQAGRIAAQAAGSVAIAGRKVTKDQILGAMGKCGKSGAVGAVIDGALGASQAGKMYYNGLIGKDIVFKHIAQEAGCGLISSAAGTAGTVTFTLITGSMGPAALITGMGASIGTRYIYRNIVDTALPTVEDLEEEENEDDLNEILEKIENSYQRPPSLDNDDDDDDEKEEVDEAVREKDGAEATIKGMMSESE